MRKKIVVILNILLIILMVSDGSLFPNLKTDGG